MTRTTARQFGRLIETGGVVNVMYGYLLGAALMIAAGIVEVFLGVEAAQKQLEDIAKKKLEDTTAGSLEACMRTIAGTARSMGIDVVG